MNRILALNILLVFFSLAIIAKLAADIVTYRLAHVLPVNSRKITTPPASPAVKDLASFSPIMEKGLFGKANQGKLTPITQEATAKGAPETSQKDLLLLGTAVGSFRETFALILKVSSKEERVFRLGDQVFDLGPLVLVKKEVAEILAGKNRIKILTPTATVDAEKAPAPLPAGAPTGLASQVGVGSYVVDQRALNAALDNIGQAMTDARLLPSVKDGKVEGFKVSEVKPAGIFGMVGIKNGDIIQRINDFPVDSPEKAIQSFVSLKGQSRIRLNLVRDGQPTTFNYDIR